MPTRVQSECPEHGKVFTPLEHVIAEYDLARQSGTYTFTCETGEHIQEKGLSEEGYQLLARAGAAILLHVNNCIIMPEEHDESLPAISQTDVQAFASDANRFLFLSSIAELESGDSNEPS